MTLTKADKSNRQFAAERAVVYRLLARLWSSELNHEMIADLSGPLILRELEEMGLATEDLRAEMIENLAVDYCRLFAGPGRLPATQSAWQHDSLHGAAADSMNKYLDFIHIDRNECRFVDQLGFQLEVMSKIVSAQDSTEPAELAGDLAKSFFLEHIAWAIELCERIEPQATTPFYRSMIETTKHFIQLELEYFNQVEPKT